MYPESYFIATEMQTPHVASLDRLSPDERLNVESLERRVYTAGHVDWTDLTNDEKLSAVISRAAQRVRIVKFEYVPGGIHTFILVLPAGVVNLARFVPGAV